MKNMGLGWTFDTVADVYEKFRPGYVDALYQTIFEYKPTDDTSRVIEIGIGGGQATLPFLQTGCELTAVDCGENFCARCREKYKEYPNFSAIAKKFEDVTLENDTYDLIYSASAFHWISEEVGYKKVYDMLKVGGAFARFANHPYRDKGKPDLSAEMDRIYADYYYKYHNKEPESPVEYTERQALDRAFIAKKYGFADIQCRLFYRTRTFSAKEYVLLLGTYSDHIVIEKNVRNRFFSEIENAINCHGGEITVYDTIDLQLARKI